MRPTPCRILFRIAPARFVRLSLAALPHCRFAWRRTSVRAKPSSPSARKRPSTRRPSARAKAGLLADGNFGVLSNGDGTYDFYAANSSKIKVDHRHAHRSGQRQEEVGTGKIWNNLPKNTLQLRRRRSGLRGCRLRHADHGLSRREALQGSKDILQRIWAWPCRSIRRG